MKNNFKMLLSDAEHAQAGRLIRIKNTVLWDKTIQV